MTTTEAGVPAEDGIYQWVPEDIYHADKGSLSVSGAKLLLPPSCPALFKEERDHGRAPKRVWDFGHVAHHLVLGKGAEFKVLAPAVHGLKKDGTVADSPRNTSKWRDAEADARKRGQVPIHIDDHSRATTMAAQVHAHPVAGPLFVDGSAEVSLYHTCPDTGVRLRARADWITLDGQLVDYKTAATANPDELERQFYKLGYFMQAAWYIDAAVAAGAVENPEFMFVVQEKVPPYLVTPVRYDDEAIAEGRRRNRQAITLYAECVASGQWPGYTDQTVTLSLPRWALPHPTTLGDVITDHYIYDTDPLEEGEFQP